MNVQRVDPRATSSSLARSAAWGGCPEMSGRKGLDVHSRSGRLRATFPSGSRGGRRLQRKASPWSSSSTQSASPTFASLPAEAVPVLIAAGGLRRSTSDGAGDERASLSTGPEFVMVAPCRCGRQHRPHRGRSRGSSRMVEGPGRPGSWRVGIQSPLCSPASQTDSQRPRSSMDIGGRRRPRGDAIPTI